MSQGSARGAERGDGHPAGGWVPGRPLPFTSPHPAWLFIAASSLNAHLLLFLGQMRLEKQSEAGPSAHTESVKGQQHPSPAPRPSQGHSGATASLRCRTPATPGAPGQEASPGGRKPSQTKHWVPGDGDPRRAQITPPRRLPAPGEQAGAVGEQLHL